MESWSFDSVGKVLVSDESVSTADAIAGGKMGSKNWEFKSPFIFGNNMVVSPNAMSIEHQGFGDMCFPRIVGNSWFSPVISATHNAFSEENESSSKLSNSVVESNCRESGLFQLNLDRIVNQGDAHIFSSSKITNNLTSAEVYMPSKQARIAGFDSPSPYCQVHGCNKSLISCKDYHKRHKVCEVHSKTARVIVNGIEQRFCQQCSRFHLLSEFDDGKRSCRKRLADHNERRRKPHVGGHSGRHGRLLPSCIITRDGGRFKGSTRARATSSSTCQNIWQVKLEDEMANDIRSMSSITDVHLHSESLSYNFGQHCPSVHGDSNDYNWASNSVFCPIFNKNPTGGTDDFITMDPMPMPSDSRSVPSLLSSQSQDTSSCHSSRNPTSSSHPLMILLSHNVHRASGVSNNINPLLGSEYVNPENQVWSGDGSTINLLQLSSELKRVEHNKEILRTKCANGASFGLSIT